jgi:hypothetical protein
MAPKDLLSAHKQAKDLDDANSDTSKKNPVGKMTTGLQQTHVIKKNPPKDISGRYMHELS